MQTGCYSPPCWRALCVLAAGLTVTLQALPTCPHLCRCDPSGSAVDCSFARLATVPERLPLNLTRLNMSHNAIKTLAPEQFATLTRLEDLDLSDNVLAYVDVDVFVGLRSLLDLRLASNRLKVLPVGIFAGLSRLRLLDVSDNELLGFLDFTFRELAGLRVLKALRNDVVFISRWAFEGLTDLRQLHLDTRNLTLVPTEAFAYLGGLTALHLHRLDSTVMPNYAFLGLGRLKELVISDWPRLETFSANSLVALNLTSLAIRSCNLSEIPYTALHHLVYLVRLDLSYNPIDYIQGNQLKELLRLEEFHMVGGQLRRIEMAAFRGLARLSLVNMSRNVLSTLEEGVFHSPNAIQRLRLDRNPLACDCRLVWLARRRLTLDFGESPPTCGSPGSWDFLKMAELLTCQSPRIRPRYPNIGRVDQGHAAVLHCNAEGRPAPSVTWLNPRRMALTDIGRVRALANGTLEVRYAQPQDAGTYRCVASNAAGNDTWPVELHVRALASNKPFHLKSWLISSPSSTAGPRDPPFDVKTLLIAASIGFLSFFSSVSVCFLAMFFWSKGKGQIKHTATIAYVPRTTATSSNGSTGNYMETSRFTMKLM